MATILSSNREQLIANFSFAAIIGPSFLIGGLNILIATFLALYFIWKQLCAGQDGTSGAPLFFAVLCLFYYSYFGWRAHDQAIDARSSRFFVENLMFIFAALFTLNIKSFSIPRILRIMGDALFPAMLLLLIITLIERYVYGVDRVIGTSRSPLILAALIVAGVHLSLADWRNRSLIWKNGAAMSWVIGLYIVLFLTESRASFGIYFICGGIFLCDVFLRVSNGWKVNMIKFFSLLLTVLGGAFSLIVALYFADLLPRVGLNISFLTGATSELDYSSASRVEMWKLGLQSIKDAPILGYGTQNTFAVIKESWPYDTDHGHLHSDILNHLVGGGLIGAMIYLSLIFSPIMFIFANRNRENLPIYICILTTSLLLFGGLTARMFLRPVPMVNTVFLLLFALAVSCHYATKRASID